MTGKQDSSIIFSLQPHFELGCSITMFCLPTSNVLFCMLMNIHQRNQPKTRDCFFFFARYLGWPWKLRIVPIEMWDFTQRKRAIKQQRSWIELCEPKSNMEFP